MDTPVEKVFGRIVQSMEDWEKENTQEKLREEIFRTLDKARDEIVRKLLGFNNGWNGKWELDHCNGRVGESAAGKLLYEAMKPEVDAWLTQITLPKMTVVFRKKVEAQLQEQYERRVQEQIYDYAKSAANATLKEIKESLLSSEIVGKYKRLQALINPENQ